MFSWKTTTKSAELAGELTELFRTSVKTKCHHPPVTDDVKWGPRCPCCSLGHPSLVLARKQSGDAQGSLGCFFFLPNGSWQPSKSGCGCWNMRLPRLFPKAREQEQTEEQRPICWQWLVVSKMPLWTWRYQILSIMGITSHPCAHPKWEEKWAKGRGWDLLEGSWFGVLVFFFSIPTASRDGDGFLKTIHSTYTKPRRVSGYFRWQNLVIPLVGVKIFP